MKISCSNFTTFCQFCTKSFWRTCRFYPQEAGTCLSPFVPILTKVRNTNLFLFPSTYYELFFTGVLEKLKHCMIQESFQLINTSNLSNIYLGSFWMVVYDVSSIVFKNEWRKIIASLRFTVKHRGTMSPQYGASFIMMHTIKLCKFNYLNAQIVSFVSSVRSSNSHPTAVRALVWNNGTLLCKIDFNRNLSF